MLLNLFKSAKSGNRSTSYFIYYNYFLTECARYAGKETYEKKQPLLPKTRLYRYLGIEWRQMYDRIHEKATSNSFM